jgi:Ger(x)C family germination protein
MPLFTEKPGHIFLSGYNVFLTFSVLEVLLFCVPLIKIKKEDIKKGKRVLHFVSRAVIIVGILDILLFIVTIGILGQGETKRKLWSMVNMIQVIKLPGGFIQRQDAIVLGIWMLSIFSIISAFFYYMSYIGRFIFRITYQNYLLVPFILILFGASVIPIETEQFFYYFEFYMKYIGMPQSLIIPVIVVLIGKVRRIKSVKQVLKTLLLLTTLTSVITLTACSDMTEIEDRNFIQAMGIDLKGNELSVYYVLPDLKALTQQGSENPEKLILELKGFDYWQIEDLYDLQYNKRLDFSHLKAIIIGKELAKNQTQLAQFLTYVEDKYEIGRSTLIFTSDTTAKEVISLNKELEGGIGDYLDRLYRINLKSSGKKVVTVGDLIFAMNEETPVVGTPVLKPRKQTLDTVGLGMFIHNQLAYEVNKEEADYIDIANAHGKNVMIFLTENTSEDLKEGKSEAASQYVVKINNVTRTLQFSSVNTKPILAIKLEGIGIIEKGLMEKGLVSNQAKAAVVEVIEERCNQLVKARITANLDRITKGAGIDFMNLYRMTSYDNRKLWLSYAGKEDQFLKDLTYTVEVDLKMQ